ncbi:MAG: UDP-2,4-diacetamido-2,4,6-trideoxy-beta-L-altropyranose hydrolase [Selenomonadaceae bacterium]|nr:UDP-2,4-diacetamido-2,4,6-trideoxy-beta-L-altropyranose hydrolase [Selenomonadaceae bacterium]
MKTVAIRVDSSRAIGSGHLMRCLTLAEQLRAKGYEAHFICRDLDGNMSRLIGERGHCLHLLPRSTEEFSLKGYAQWLTVPQSLDADETKAILNRLGTIDLLVIDSYAIDIEWETAMRPLVEKIFVIDDLANRRHDCDVLLDQNFHVDGGHRYDDLVPERCELRIGIKHALLRAEFYEAKKHLRRRDGSVKNIFVFYGGIDQTNETMKALRALTMIDLPELVVNAVVGGSNPHRLEVERYCRRNGFNYRCQVDNMAELMNAADLSLGAGGTTTWERMFLGLPTLLTAIADNQNGAEILETGGYIIYLGKAQDCTEELIARSLESLTRDRLLQMRERCLSVWEC